MVNNILMNIYLSRPSLREGVPNGLHVGTTLINPILFISISPNKRGLEGYLYLSLKPVVVIRTDILTTHTTGVL